MSRKHAWIIAAVTAAFAFMATEASAASTPAEHRPPNIVFILIDNCGKEWFGCYGSQENLTPNIDRLAEHGLRVEHCYTPVVCGPSRIVALTGRYLLRSGMTLHHDAALYSGGGLDPQREVTFARPLRDAGYATAISGKWQINNLYDEPGVIERHGFQQSLVWPGSIDRDRVSDADLAKFRRHVDAFDPQFTSTFISNIESRYWNLVAHRNGKREVHTGRFGPDVFQEFAFEFMAANRERPFMLYYPMVLTHGHTFLHPVVPTPLNMDENRPHIEMFRDMIRYSDKLVGDFVAELDRLGLRENTIVFIATDNGTEKSFSARANGRIVNGGLYQLNEAGGNVPLIVNCPRLVPGGRTLKLADFSDLLPTFCDLAGAKLPQGVTIDGRSFADVLLAKPAAAPPRQWIFNQYDKQRLVSDGRFKLWSDGRLFDIAADPTEQHNLAASSEPAVAAARQRLQVALDSLPPDSPPPFKLRSQSAFRLEQEARRRQSQP